MNTANKLTLLRVVMIPAFLLVLYLDVPGASYWALAIFVAASLTDTLDGYIARHYNQVTDFGKFMDPLADKCLVVAAMLWFVEIGQMPAWAVLIVVIREFAVSGLRMVAQRIFFSRLSSHLAAVEIAFSYSAASASSFVISPRYSSHLSAGTFASSSLTVRIPRSVLPSCR